LRNDSQSRAQIVKADLRRIDFVDLDQTVHVGQAEERLDQG